MKNDTKPIGSEIDHTRAVASARETMERWRLMNYHTDEAHLARAYLDLCERVLPKLRREHAMYPGGDGWNYGCDKRPCAMGHGPKSVCDCGADEANALIDAVIGKRP